MTREEACQLYDSKFWEGMSHKDIAIWQLHEARLCMPFGVFHEAMGKALDRPVFTHEFALNYDGLKKELMGECESPSFEDIVNMIPEDKRFIVVHGQQVNSPD